MLVLDGEFSVTHREDKSIDNTPFNSANKLVSVGWSHKEEQEKEWSPVAYKCFYHKSNDADPDASATLQQALDSTTLVIGHFVKIDMTWLYECGFTYDGAIWCTGLAEYILQRGITKALSLEELCIEYDLTRKRTDLTAKYWDAGIGYEAMPWPVVEEYGKGDIVSTRELFALQWAKYHSPQHGHLLPTLRMSCELLKVLIEFERNGVKIDVDKLNEVEAAYYMRLKELEISLNATARSAMGDIPVQLSSPDYRSKLFFSRSINDKKVWHSTFNIGKDMYGRPNKPVHMTKDKFNKVVRSLSTVIKKQIARSCETCDGDGTIQKVKKDGSYWTNRSNCTQCAGVGILYSDSNHTGGFKLLPRGPKDTSNAGFSSDKETLSELKDTTASVVVRKFIDEFIEYNATQTYLNTFVEGIRRFKSNLNFLHTKYNQAVTATGRLSSSEPNMMNMPRGKTFPVKKAFVSRFPGGHIIEADYAGLEFRIAGALSGDVLIRNDIDTKVDPHAFTRDTINNFDPALPQIDRQGAKEHTFKPLYGGTSGSPREQSYYQAFMAKYVGLARWQETIKDLAVRTKLVRLPSGREYAFPRAKRLPNGYILGTTQIVNYPVQGYATADIAPCGFIGVFRAFKRHKLSSLLIMTTHDSLHVDCYPGEREQVIEALKEGMLAIPELMMEFYGYVFNFPIGIEIKEGPDAFNLKVVGAFER